MRRLKLILQYDGTRYSGWQKQNGSATLQESLEKTITKLTRETVTLQGASRTDAGVHALGQVAHFDDAGRFPLGKYAQALNALLPDDVAVISAEEVPATFHARFDAQAKWYRYRVRNLSRKTIFNRSYAWQITVPLDLQKMQQAAASFIGEHDFTSFKTFSSQNRDTSNLRTISKLDIAQKGEEILFDIEGNGFLYKMVRGMVGSLVEVGRGKFPPEWIREVLEKRDRPAAGPNAPAHGLFLMQVYYAAGEVAKRIDFSHSNLISFVDFSEL